MNLSKIVVAVGVVSLVVGMISRLMMMPVPPIGLEASAFLKFASTCFLLAIALSVMPCKK